MEKIAQYNEQEEASLEKILYLANTLSTKDEENDEDIKEFITLINEHQNINAKNSRWLTLLHYLIENGIDQVKYLDLAKEILSRNDVSINGKKEDYYYNSYKTSLKKLSICEERGLLKTTPKYLEIIKLMETHPNFVDYSLKCKIKAFKDRVQFICQNIVRVIG
ncbi:hypothetical protein KAZ01_03545 [Candidatus Gracilibacteria bacterium]|nr:hypothetical protein [Candidatus Gracilibacteria bacterium]